MFKTSLAGFFFYEKRLRRYFSGKMKVEMGRGYYHESKRVVRLFRNNQ